MKISVICHEDYANYGYENAKAMRYVGLEAKSYVLKRHSFYKEQSELVSINSLSQIVKTSDVVIVMHSCGTSLDIVKDYVGQKQIIVFHTGTRYRSDPEKHNKRWNDIADKIVIALGEFENLGAKNPIYLGITVDCDKIKPDYRLQEKLRIAHYPSNPDVKGTKIINKVVKQLQSKYDFIYNHSIEKVGYDRQLTRMNDCDIYIELCAPLNNGNPYGSFGTTAVEAAAMGKVVVTNNLWEKLYLSEYQNCALEIANNETDLYNRLEKLLNLHQNDLLQKKIASRLWAERCHGYEATGKRMKLLIEN